MTARPYRLEGPEFHVRTDAGCSSYSSPSEILSFCADWLPSGCRLAGGSLSTTTRVEIGQARMTHLQGECSTSYRRADSVRRFNVGRVLLLINPPGI